MPAVRESLRFQARRQGASVLLFNAAADCPDSMQVLEAIHRSSPAGTRGTP